MYPPEVTVTTISSRSMRSSSSISPDHSTISVRRGTANCSFTSFSSVIIIDMICSREPKMARYSFIFFERVCNSSVTSFTPICVRRCNLNSSIARAWVSDRLYVSSSLIVCVGSSISLIYSAIDPAGHRRCISFSRASAASEEDLIVATTSSTLVTATARPQRMWERSLALRSSKAVRRATTISLKSMKLVKKDLKVNCSGLPPLSASMLHPKEVCIGVNR